MRVAVVAPEFPPELGGVETYGYQYTRELARRGHQVTVFTLRHRQGEVCIPGVTVVPGLSLCRNLDRAFLHEPAAEVWHVMNAAYSWLAGERANVVVSIHGNDFLRPYYPVARPGLSRLPGLWRLQRFMAPVEEYLGRRLTPGLLRRTLPKARHILSNSRYTEEVFLQSFPECSGRTSAAMVGVAREFFLAPRPAPRPGAPTQLVTICRLSEPRKNVDLVLRALGVLQQRYDFRYSVIGDGHLRPGLEQLCAELGLAGRVSFHGFLPGAELTRRLAAADLFVLASSAHPESHEGFGIAYLEANACGTPVLAARLAGAVEAVEDGVSGYFAEAVSLPSLAASLERFLKGELVFEAAACRAFAGRFTWEKVVDHALSFYPGGTQGPSDRGENRG